MATHFCNACVFFKTRGDNEWLHNKNKGKLFHPRLRFIYRSQMAGIVGSDILCGCGTWNPSLIQRFSRPAIFTCHIGIIYAISLCANMYFNGILTTLELQFQLSSSEVAVLTVLNDISILCLVLFVTHFGQKSDRPKWIGCGALLISVGMICCAVPHFVSDPIDPESLISGGTGTLAARKVHQSSKMLGICRVISHRSNNQTSLSGNGSFDSTIRISNQCQDESISKEGMGPVKWIVLGQIIWGCGSAPLMPLALSYIDDAVKKHTFTSYTGTYSSPQYHILGIMLISIF